MGWSGISTFTHDGSPGIHLLDVDACPNACVCIAVADLTGTTDADRRDDALARLTDLGVLGVDVIIDGGILTLTTR